MNTGFTRNTKSSRVYRTPKGTELPILNLRGRDYLEVKFRLVWFREEHPDWSIETEILSATETSAYARATIKDEHGRIIATSHKFETKQGFPDFIEKSETGAIGRALALIGFGTQFCADELDEGERIVDSPVDHGQPAEDVESDKELSEKLQDNRDSHDNPEDPGQSLDLGKQDPGDYRISFGKKYKGRRLKEIPRREIESYVEWLEASANKKGVPLTDEALFLKMAVSRFLAEGHSH